jgi:pimeloyl-ACP methyl ester carboxylesterase
MAFARRWWPIARCSTGRASGANLWLQPARREDFRGYNRQLVAPGHDGRRQAHYHCIKAFSEVDFTEDLKAIGVPTLVMHGDDNQIVPMPDSAPLSAKLLRHATLKIYPGFPHGMCTTHPEVINLDLLAFIKS